MVTGLACTNREQDHLSELVAYPVSTVLPNEYLLVAAAKQRADGGRYQAGFIFSPRRRADGGGNIQWGIVLYDRDCFRYGDAGVYRFSAGSQGFDEPQ